MTSAAGPYGYTISLGGSTVVAVRHLGAPHLLSALALMVGSVVAFVLLELGAQRTLLPSPAAPDLPPSVWGNAHVPSAGGAICAVWGLVHVVGHVTGWLLVGFAATATYFAVTAIQRIAIAAVRERLRSRRGDSH